MFTLLLDFDDLLVYFVMFGLGFQICVEGKIVETTMKVIHGVVQISEFLQILDQPKGVEPRDDFFVKVVYSSEDDFFIFFKQRCAGCLYVLF